MMILVKIKDLLNDRLHRLGSYELIAACLYDPFWGSATLIGRCGVLSLVDIPPFSCLPNQGQPSKLAVNSTEVLARPDMYIV